MGNKFWKVARNSDLEFVNVKHHNIMKSVTYYSAKNTATMVQFYQLAMFLQLDHSSKHRCPQYQRPVSLALLVTDAPMITR